MAKQDRTGTSKMKIRFLEVDVEGNDESLQDVVRTLQVTLSARPRNGVPSRVIASGSGPVVAHNEAASPSADEPIETDAEDIDASSETERARPARPPRSYKEPTWDILDLDIKSGKLPLEDFMKSAPDVIQRRFLMLVYWLKVYRSIDVINPSHMFTCYRALGWNVPKSMLQPLVDLRRKRQFLDKGKGEHEFQINMPGMSEVERMLKAPTK
jgi:hypothetical protein